MFKKMRRSRNRTGPARWRIPVLATLVAVSLLSPVGAGAAAPGFKLDLYPSMVVVAGPGSSPTTITVTPSSSVPVTWWWRGPFGVWSAPNGLHGGASALGDPARPNDLIIAPALLDGFADNGMQFRATYKSGGKEYTSSAVTTSVATWTTQPVSASGDAALGSATCTAQPGPAIFRAALGVSGTDPYGTWAKSLNQRIQWGYVPLPNPDNRPPKAFASDRHACWRVEQGFGGWESVFRLSPTEAEAGKIGVVAMTSGASFGSPEPIVRTTSATTPAPVTRATAVSITEGAHQLPHAGLRYPTTDNQLLQGALHSVLSFDAAVTGLPQPLTWQLGSGTTWRTLPDRGGATPGPTVRSGTDLMRTGGTQFQIIPDKTYAGQSIRAQIRATDGTVLATSNEIPLGVLQLPSGLSSGPFPLAAGTGAAATFERVDSKYPTVTWCGQTDSKLSILRRSSRISITTTVGPVGTQTNSISWNEPLLPEEYGMQVFLSYGLDCKGARTPVSAINGF